MSYALKTHEWALAHLCESDSELLEPIHIKFHRLSFQECWSVHIITEVTTNYIRHQFERPYQLVLQFNLPA